MSICKAIILQKFEEDIEDNIDTVLELNNEDIVTNEKVVEIYIKVLKKFL